jgi:hypothetical protein
MTDQEHALAPVLVATGAHVRIGEPVDEVAELIHELHGGTPVRDTIIASYAKVSW